MKLPGLVFAGLLALGLSTYSCANGDTVSGSPGSGGDNGSGNGGSSEGGSTGSGGSSKGGSTGSGGSSKGGNTGSGGSVSSSGGSTGSGGSSKGGNTGSGGNVSSTGGNTGSGGNSSSSGGTSGSTGAGGSTAISCGSTFSANTGGWVLAPAAGGGCWHGYAFAFTETPNCGSTVMPKDFSACTANCALSIMGSCAAATMANSYCGVSGMGFAINQAQGATAGTSIAPTGTGLKVAFTESTGGNPFRIQLRDDATSTNWCYDATTATSPVMVPYTSFNTQCWTGGAGTAYAKQPFTSVQLLVAGGMAAANYSITMTSVTEY